MILPIGIRVSRTLIPAALLLMSASAAFAQAPNGRLLQSADLVGAGSRLCLTVNNPDERDGVNVELGNCRSDVAGWDFIDIGNREVAVVNRATGKVLDVSGGSQDDGANVQQWSWNGSGAQRWRQESSGFGVRLVNVNSGKCLDVSNNATHMGANVAQYRCNGGDNQRWQIQNVSGGGNGNPSRPWVLGEPANPGKPTPNIIGGRPSGRLVYAGMIVSRVSSKCIDIEKGSRDDGTNIRQWTCNGTGAQLWDFIEVGRGEVAIVSRGTGKVMDLVGSQSGNGANIAQYAWNGGPNQRWRIEQAGRGFFRIVSVASQKCLDLDNAGLDDGANVQQWECHGRENQQWRIEVLGNGIGWRNYQLGNGADPRYADAPPSYAIGTWRGFNPIYGSTVEITIHDGGDVQAVVDGSLRVNGYFRSGVMFLGTERFEVQRDGNGIATLQIGASSNRVRYTRVR